MDLVYGKPADVFSNCHFNDQFGRLAFVSVGASSHRPAGRHFMKPVLRRLGLGGMIFILWIMLSGHFSVLFLSLGLASCALVVWLTDRMNLHTGALEQAPNLWKALQYTGWLAREIFLSNLKVARLILDPALPARPVLFWAPASQGTDAGRVLFANSITLTPGTISIEISKTGKQILVHSLHEDFAWGPDGGGMDARVSALGL